MHPVLDDVFIFYILTCILLKYRLIHWVYVPIIIWGCGIRSRQKDACHVSYGPVDIHPYIEVGPYQYVNFLDISCEFIFCLPLVGKVVNLCDSVLILQAILSPFEFTSNGCGSLGIYWVLTTATLSYYVMSLTGASSGVSHTWILLLLRIHFLRSFQSQSMTRHPHIPS